MFMLIVFVAHLFACTLIKDIKIIRPTDMEPVDIVVLKILFKVLLCWEHHCKQIFNERKSEMLESFSQFIADEDKSTYDFEKILKEVRESKLTAYGYDEDIWQYLQFKDKEAILTVLITIVSDAGDITLSNGEMNAVTDIANSFEFPREYLMAITDKISQ